MQQDIKDAATGGKDQLDANREPDKTSEEQTFSQIKDTRKRRRTGEDAAESKRQKTVSSQQPDAVQARSASDGATEPINWEPSSPLECITSLLRHLAGSKSADKPEVDAICPLQTPAEVSVILRKITTPLVIAARLNNMVTFCFHSFVLAFV